MMTEQSPFLTPDPFPLKSTTRDPERTNKNAELSIQDMVEVYRQKEYLVARPRTPLSTREMTPCSVPDLEKRCDLFNDAHVPAIFMKASFTHLDDSQQNTPAMTRAVRWIQRWTKPDQVAPEGIILLGPNGIGKSFALAALVRFLTVQLAIPSWFVSFDHFLHDLKACFQGKNDEERLWERIRRIEVIGLDDVASARPSDWTREILRTIIAYRYNAHATTILTTNLTLLPGATTDRRLTLPEWTGNHCFSRLMQMCYFLPVAGPDLRKNALPHNEAIMSLTRQADEKRTSGPSILMTTKGQSRKLPAFSS